MTYKQSLLVYVLTLLIAILALLTILPPTFGLTFSKERFCSRLNNWKDQCQSIPFLPLERVFNVTLPSFSLGGKTITLNKAFLYGVDINGGMEVVLLVDLKQIGSEERQHALNSAREIIQRRLTLIGVKEFSVVPSKALNQDHLLVTIPNAVISDQVLGLIGSSAKLEFREYIPASPSAKTQNNTASGSTTASSSGYLVSDFKPTDITGGDLVRATAIKESGSDAISVGIEFSQEGRVKFAELTKKSIGKPLAVFIDDYPLSAPIVTNQITDGRAQINGQFNEEQADSLAATLNAGVLVVPIQVLSQERVQAQLGVRILKQLTVAGVIGILLTTLFFILLYGRQSWMAAVVILLFVIFNLSVIKLFSIPLRASGLMGMYLALALLIDALILLFEQLKEEEGAIVNRTAILKRSFRRLFDATKDASLLTLGIAFLVVNPFSWVFLPTLAPLQSFGMSLAVGLLINEVLTMVVMHAFTVLFFRSREVL